MATDREGAPPDPGRGDLGLAVALALVAGFVDAVCFLHLFGVFPANQSGNAVLLGIGIAGEGSTPVWASATALLAYVGGVSLAVRRRARGGRLLALEAALLVPVAAVAAAAPHGVAGLGALPRAGLLAVTGVAMGVQTESARRAGGVAVSTTYQTGALTRIAEAVAGPGGTRWSAAAGVLGAVFGAYVAGAAIGASPLGRGAGAMAVAVVAVGVAALVAARLDPDRDGPDRDGRDPDGRDPDGPDPDDWGRGSERRR